MGPLAWLRRWLTSRRLPRQASAPPNRIVYAINASTKLVWFSERLEPGQIVVVRGRSREAMTIVAEVWHEPRVGYQYRVVRGMANTLARPFRAGDSVTVIPPPA